MNIRSHHVWHCASFVVLASAAWAGCSGRVATQTECPDEYCLNGGTCMEGSTGYTCQCAPGYTGVHCEVDIDYCAGDPCPSGSICVDGLTDYTCQYNEETFRDDFDAEEVDTSVWHVATWSEHGGQTSAERCYVADGYLNLVFINDDGVYLSAAIQTWDEFLYGRWEARLKPSAVAGVLNSMYTIDWNDTTDDSANDNGTKQEIDIEFLTYTFAPSSGEVHFAVHAAGLDSFGTNPDIHLDFNPSDDFHVWGFDITPEHIQWFVDDTVLLTYTYSEHDISIDAPYQLKFNVWTMVDWIHGPPVPDTECVYQIDWIRFIPYDNP